MGFITSVLKKATLKTAAAPMLLAASFVLGAGRPGTNHSYRHTGYQAKNDTVPSGTTLPYPITDRRGDSFSTPRNNPFDLKDPKNITKSIEYDPVTKQYYIVEKIGNRYYRRPTSISFDDFLKMQSDRAEADYFRQRANTLFQLNRKKIKPGLKIKEDMFNRIFGNGKIDIRPQGNIDITAGYFSQNIQNPTLPERARKQGGFDFDMNADLNVIANIGDKMKFPIQYSTTALQDFQNQLKLDYTGGADEIIKKVEAGNVNFSSKSAFIPPAQQLFGVKTSLQFGKLNLTTVLANQRSQRQNTTVQGGAVATPFEIKVEDYEENRHFLLAHYFRKNYKKNMANLPLVTSNIQILRMEVWATNRQAITTDTREIVAIADLAESDPSGNNPSYPYNDANGLYAQILANPNTRQSNQVVSGLQAIGLRPIQDFEKTYARKLQPSEYYFNPQIGFISLNTTLQADEVLGVAYQYTVNGRVYQVGEFSQDVPPDTSNGVQKVLFLKMLKATSQRPSLPIWKLMMKNVYSVGYGQLEQQNFQLNVLYQQPGAGEKRYLPVGVSPYKGEPLLTLMGLDRLNGSNVPQPDGVFDYIEGYTVISSQSRIIFPALEPFGHDLDYIFGTGPGASDTAKQYLYYPLYDSIKAIAALYPNLNRFIIKGKSKTAAAQGGQIPLGFNVQGGSVRVTAGGQLLRENQDYVVDPSTGSVTIINEAIRASGVPINISYEDNNTFGIQQQNFLGLRADYQVNRKLGIGATVVKLGERPFFTKMEYGQDPIRNTMLSVDFNYRSEVPRLNKWLDKIPFYTPQGQSSVTAYGEVAKLIPGHPKQIGRGKNGLIYIDDFEGTRNAIDLRFPFIAWALASTPSNARDVNNNLLFPEADLNNNLEYNKNRAKISWYQIEPNLQDKRSGNNPLKQNLDELSNLDVRALRQDELFPQRTPDLGANTLITFDMSYFPREKGPYNFETSPTEIDANGNLLTPRKRWGGITRALDQTDFETGNVEFIEFWVHDPYLTKPNLNPGYLYFNLGNISEDVMKDGRRFFENGVSTPFTPSLEDTTTVWGKTPLNPVQVTNGFSNNPDDRPYQDVGLDGLTDSLERIKFVDYLTKLNNNFPGAPVTIKAQKDPSNDNFVPYRDASYDAIGAGIVTRYKNYNNTQGNSPIAAPNQTLVTAATQYPDQEDLNRDNTLNEAEEYFEYRVELKPNMQVGDNYIVDKREYVIPYELPNGTKPTDRWYLFRIPISEYARKVGSIPDFKSIRFMRMFMTGFDDSVTLRFAKLELVRNQWRRFNFVIDSTGRYIPASSNNLIVGAVNIEENDTRVPIPYRVPTGIERVQQLSNNNVNILQNEQSMSLKILNLADGDAKGVFKTFNLDLRQYKRLNMFIHAEGIQNDPTSVTADDQLYAVVRLGQDFISNYYEIKIPLKLTPFGATDTARIWPAANYLDFNLDILPTLKTARNKTPGFRYDSIYRQQIDGRTYSLMGNPNLGEIKGMLFAIENPHDDERERSAEIWIDELRLSQLDEQGGIAAQGRVEVQLADLGNLAISGLYKTRGFGDLTNRVNDRLREDVMQFDIAANLELGKMIPKKAALSIPVYANYSQKIATPEYDPFDQDIKLKDKLKAASNSAEKDSIRKQSVEITKLTTVSFTNVRKLNNTGKKQKIYSIENFDLSYIYTRKVFSSPTIEMDQVINHKAGIGYTYNGQPKYWEPLKKRIKTKTHWFDLVKDFNLNPVPSLIGFRADIDRQFGATRPRAISVGAAPDFNIPETYDKYFWFTRNYNLRWDITRSVNIDFKSTNKAFVDEPAGRLNSKAKRDSMWRNFWKFGRNTEYRQTATLSYLFPINKFPLMDWTKVRFNYTANYNWIGASLLQRNLGINLGNTIENTSQRQARGELDFNMLYNKVRWLRAVSQAGNNQQQQRFFPQQNQAAKPDTLGKKKTAAKKLSDKKKEKMAKKEERKKNRLQKKKDPNRLPQLSGFEAAIGKIITSVKRADIDYTENFNTRLPGFTDSTQYLGNNWKSGAPGLGFIFGMQPDKNWLNKAASKGWLTTDSNFNFLFTQNFEQRLKISVNLQPVRDFNIDFNWEKSFNKNYQELFKDTLAGSGKFAHLNPYAGGGFSVSFVSFQTLFGKFSPTAVSETFKKFEENRLIISRRLGIANPNSASQGIQADGYYYGYGRYAQDVLIPAFISAYTKKDPNSISLLKQSNDNIRTNPFAGFKPMPNWRINYSGLSRLKPLEKLFSSIIITHAYTGTLSMNSYTSALLYQQDTLGFPKFYDTVSKSFIPFFLVPNISINEAFSPLVGFDFQTTNDLSARFEFKKSRQLSLSLIDYQLSEMRSTEFTIGGTWRKRGLNLKPIMRIFKKDAEKLKNDVTFRLDVSVRDDATSNTRLDQPSSLVAGGQKVVTISPSIDYVINNRVNIKFYFDRRSVKPYVSTSPPTTNTRAGLQLRIALQ
jgi:cell surface protein SprA